MIIIHTDTEVLGARLEERVLLGLGAFAGAEGSGGGLLTGGLGLGRLVIETRSHQCHAWRDSRRSPGALALAHKGTSPALYACHSQRLDACSIAMIPMC